MLRYRGSNLIRAGFIGVVLIILVIAIGLQPERLIQWATSLRYQALFSEAGGLAVGNDVTVSGIKVGTVSSIELDNGDALAQIFRETRRDTVLELAKVPVLQGMMRLVESP
jgi:phospholipid/cholesterol/gamma-HCH transport system substrate-binding protein